MLFLLTIITFVDRICISTASDFIMADLRISKQTMGYIFGVFAVSYALFQIPSGWLADTYGPKRSLLFVVSFWSLFTALTGAAWNAGSMLITRFLFGTGEAGAFPGATRAIFNWVNTKERGLANGIFHSGGRIGAATALFLMPWLIHQVGWRGAFFINGIIGIVWAIIWLAWFHDSPRQNKKADEAECRHIEEGTSDEVSASEHVPFGIIITSPNMAFAMFQYIASNATFFISLSWLFPYLKSQWGAGAAKFAAIPLIVGMVAHWSSGALVTFLHKKGHQVGSLRVPALIGFALAATGLVLCTQVAPMTATLFVVCFSVAIFGVEMTVAPSWTFCMDIGGNKSGAVSGTMNMMGNLGSAASAVSFPYFVDHVTIPRLVEKTGTANSFFILAATLNALAFVAWMFMNPRRGFNISPSGVAVRLRLALFMLLAVVVLFSLCLYKALLVK
jgi:ACS family glucarate transporter-like MFS transporter